ncbi:MAG TPA: competence/damage-inducible protein A [Candidatus Eisenbacteria bacterium]|nr:competence/damage-inducible protein A [Candidatus Eisenbacteria bacterium]
MRIEIVTIGNEVLSGRTLDTNFAFLARALERVGVQVGWHTTVGDDGQAIGDALRAALARADAVVTTGGLGPTPDDITRAAVARVLGRPLTRDDAVLERIRERMRRLGRAFPESVETQAMLPEGASTWLNRLGTAPGIVIEQDGKPLAMLPGVPQEMEGLAREHLVPWLQKRSGLAVETFTLRTAGAFETMLQEAIGALPDGWPGATLAYLPSWTGVDLRVTVAGRDADAVRATATRAREQLMSRVEPVVYAEGERGMEDVVGESLKQLGWRLATAESCTGGLLAKRVTDVAGSSAWFERGFVTYSNTSKIELLGVRSGDIEAHGAVSAPVAEQMAEGARKRAGVEVGIGITGVAGPGGGSEEKPVGTVFIAVASPRGAAGRKLNITGPRNAVRERSAQAALDLVRRNLVGLPVEPRLG